MTSDFQQIVFDELSKILNPLKEAAEEPQRILRLFGEIGWDLNAVSGLPINQIVEAIVRFSDNYDQIVQYVEHPPTSLNDVLKGLQTAAAAFRHIRSISELIPTASRPEAFDQIAQDLIEHLVIRYLAGERPVLWHTAILLGIADEAGINVPEVPAVMSQDGKVLRYPHKRQRLQLNKLGDLLRDPGGTLRDEYLSPTGLDMAADTHATSRKLFGRLAALLRVIGLNAVSGIDLGAGYDLGSFGNDMAEDALSFTFPFDLSPDASARAGATLVLSSGETGGLGLVVIPSASLAFSHEFPSWLLEMLLSAGIPAFALGKQGFTLLSDEGATNVHLSAKLTKLAEEDGAAILIGSADGTHLEIGKFSIIADAMLEADKQDYGLLMEAGKAAFVVRPAEGDGFLQKVIPKDGFHFEFDLALGWSKRKGLYFRGSAGLEATLPVHADLGFLKVNSAYLALRAINSDINVIMGATAQIKLGPFTANVEQVGMQFKLTFPQEGGNLGPMNLVPAFKPPSGAGMVIDASAVTGGGYLFFDPDNEQYSGILQLEIKGGISIKAVGLLTTRMPDGSKGFSLLVILTAEFPPIQLGFGFSLNGLGGLLGANRTMSVDVLRAGIKNRALDSIMFPPNPVENASKIISDLQSIFPPAPGRFVFGPMAKLAWGTPTVLTAELGILLELPSPVRLVLLGRMKLVLPKEEAAVAQLHMDVIGVIDFDKGDVSLDATLYDSRIAVFVITGDMAMRLNFGASPSFALAAGGFNPRFQPPPGFPALDRMAISLADSDNPRLRLEAYMAVTSNTFQIGARLDLYAAKDTALGLFSVEAYLGFDALIQFDPFGFIADIGGGAALKRNGDSLAAVQIQMMLTGPKPIHAQGKATFEFLGKREISFELSIGDPEPPPALPPVDALAALRTALADRRNWSAQLSGDGRMLVTLRELPEGPEVLVHPLGELTVSQKVLPLGLEITKFGNAKPVGGRSTYNITSVSFGATPVNQLPAVKDAFAPAMFFEMSDAEKLSRPAFEQLQSGVRTSLSNLSHGTSLAADFEYETAVIDKVERVSLKLGRQSLDAGTFAILAELGSAANSPMNSTGAARFAGPARKIICKEPSYSVVSADNMKIPNGSVFKQASNATFTEAEQVRRKSASAAAGSAGRLQVVGSHEVVK